MSDTTTSPRRRGPLRWIVRLALLVIVLVVLLVAALPTILSTDSFRNTLTSGANEALAGTVAIEQLDFGWTTAQRIEGLSVWPGEAGRGEPLFALPEAEFDLAFLALLQGIDVRADVTGFNAHLRLHEDGTTSIDDLLGRAPPPGEPGPPEPSPEPDREPAPPRPERPREPVEIEPVPLRADIRLRDGTAIVVDEGTGITTGVEELVVEITSAEFDDPVQVVVTGRSVLADTRAPFELRASGLGADDPGWTFSFRSDGLQPGSVTQPLLVALFPLLASDDPDERVEIDAPLGLELALSGTSLEELANGVLTGLSGRIALELGDGRVEGGLLGRVEDAFGEALASADAQLGGVLDQLGGQLGDQLGGVAGDRRLDLQFHGLSGALVLDGGRLAIDQLALVDEAGTSRPLPIEGHVQLATALADSTLHYRIPWSGLVTEPGWRELLGDAAIAVEGPIAAPRFDLGIDFAAALRSAAEGRLQRELEGLEDQLGEKLGEKLGQDVDLRGVTDPAKARETLGGLFEKAVEKAADKQAEKKKDKEKDEPKAAAKPGKGSGERGR